MLIWGDTEIGLNKGDSWSQLREKEKNAPRKEKGIGSRHISQDGPSHVKVFLISSRVRRGKETGGKRGKGSPLALFGRKGRHKEIKRKSFEKREGNRDQLVPKRKRRRLGEGQEVTSLQRRNAWNGWVGGGLGGGGGFFFGGGGGGGGGGGWGGGGGGGVDCGEVCFLGLGGGFVGGVFFFLGGCLGGFFWVFLWGFWGGGGVF